VYQAELFTGERVAVKVRRPNIGQRFAADLRALDWLLLLSEWLTIVRPGFTANVRHDLRATLFEELDFRKEARYQALFRRRARKKSSRRFFSAPRVYFELSNEEIIVQEFAAGLWMWELIEIVDRQDPAGLAYLRQCDIDPKAIAKRLHWVAQWGMISDLFFHADPHPANVIVRPHNRLVFIDFGSCGSYDSARRGAMQQLFYHQQRDDVAGMVQASLHLLEPLPPIDVGEFSRELQAVYRQQQFSMRSKEVSWFERCASGLFIEMIGLTRKYNIPMNADVLRIARANLLYDTLAARLDSDVTSEKVYRRFLDDMGRQSRKRVQRSIRRRLAGGLTTTDYMAVERTVDMGVRFLYRVQRFLEMPGLKLPYLVEKWVYAASSITQLVLLLGTLTAVLAAVVGAVDLLIGREVDIVATCRAIVTNGWFQGLAGVLSLLTVRRILFRLNDKGAAAS
jgi:ubiquinone biosynthesis protein